MSLPQNLFIRDPLLGRRSSGTEWFENLHTENQLLSLVAGKGIHKSADKTSDADEIPLNVEGFQTDGISVSEETVHYLELEKFNHQLNEVENFFKMSVSNFPSHMTENVLFMENFLNESVKLSKESRFHWSHIPSDTSDVKFIYISSSDPWVLIKLRKLLSGFKIEERVLSVYVDRNVDEALKELDPRKEPGEEPEEEPTEDTRQGEEPTEKGTTQEESAENLKQTRLSLFSFAQLLKRKLSKTSPEKSEEQDYNVDLRELVDVPRDFVPKVQAAIVEFRLKVVKMERAKRENLILNDKRKARIKLRRMFQDLSKRAGGIDEDEMEEDFSDDEQIVDDEEMEKAHREQVKKDIESQVSIKQQHMARRDKARLSLLKNFESVVEHSHYEQVVVPERANKFIKEFVEGVDSAKNKIDENLDSYYLKHSNYLSFRNAAKVQEAAADDADRRLAEQETQQAQEFVETGFGKPVKLVMKRDMSEDVAEKLRTEVESRIEELLGTKEESLIDFIMDFVKVHQDRSDEKALGEFITELGETLEEDAPVLVDSIYHFLENM